MKFIPTRLHLFLLLGVATSVLAQAPDGPGGPPPDGGGRPPGGPGGFGGPGGPGGFGGVQEETKLVKKFDQDGDKRLNADERKAALEFLASERAAGRGRRGFGGPRGGGGGGGGGGENQEPPKPGPKVSPTEVKSAGNAPLYDPQTMRTLFFEFEEPEWEKQLAEFKNTDVEVPARLTVDGKVLPEVGMKFRGMSSFGMVGEGWKRSFNVSLDFAHKDQALGGYRTLNLLNSHDDASFLRGVLYSEIARNYIPTPKANLVRVVINGESWGVYVNVQQFNKDFTKEWFHSTKGVRWKAPGSPGGRASLKYLGDDVAAYRRIFEIKSKDEPKAWNDLIRLCKVLTETPTDQLEAALEPVLDIDGALKFLALDNALINNDGYWVRTSDYALYQDEKGRFHILPSDFNETFTLPGGPGFGGGGRGGRGGGGPGGFGPAMMVGREMFTQADSNSDQKVTKPELAELADRWFKRMDEVNSGKISRDQFTDRLAGILPPPQGARGPGPGPDGGPPGGRGGFGPAMAAGEGIFAAADANKDGALTAAELRATFETWATDWDSNKTGSLDEEKLRTGLASVLPRPNFGGPGGPGGPGGGGPGGFGGPGGGGGPGGFGGPGGGRGPGGGMPRVNGVELDPLVIANDPERPLASKLLAVPALRARYLGYVREIAEKWLDWKTLGPIAEKYHTLIAEEVKRDTRKLDSTEAFAKSLSAEFEETGGGGGGRGPQRRISLKRFADQRRAYLLKQTATEPAAPK